VVVVVVVGILVSTGSHKPCADSPLLCKADHIAPISPPSLPPCISPVATTAHARMRGCEVLTIPSLPPSLPPASLPPSPPCTARMYARMCTSSPPPQASSSSFLPPSIPPSSPLLSLSMPTHTHTHIPGKGKGGGRGRWCARYEANGGKGGAASSSPGSRPCPEGKAGRRASIVCVYCQRVWERQFGK